MAKLAPVLASIALIVALFPSGMYVAMGLSVFSATLGLLVFRRRDAPPWSRLSGALALTLGSIALLLSAGRFALTWWAIDKLSDLLS